MSRPGIATLALFRRAVRQQARSWSTYSRHCVLVAVTLAFLLLQSFSWRVAPGRDFLSIVAFVCLLYICLIGLNQFATVITEEKEQQALGLLRLTGMGPLAILVGSAGSRLLAAVLLVSLQLPFTLLAVTLGGVSIRQVIAVYCCLLSFLFFFCNLALFCSVLCPRSSAAAGLTGVLGFLFTLGPTFYMNLWVPVMVRGPAGRARLSGGSFMQWARSASPFERLIEVMQTGFSGHPVSLQAVSNLIGGVLFFVAAWLCFGAARDTATAGPARGLLGRRRRFGPGRAWAAAVCWKDYHFLGGGAPFIVLKTALLATLFVAIEGGWYAMVVRQRPLRPYDWQSAGLLLLAATVVMMLIDVGFQAGRIFREEARWQTLGTLALLPRSLGRTAYDKVLGALPGMLPYLGFICLAGLLAGDEFSDLIKELFSEPGGVLCLGFVVLFAHLSAYLSLALPRGAAGLALVGMILASILFVSLLDRFFIRSDDAIGYVLAGLYLFLAGIVHTRIGSRLHHVAAQ